MKGKSWERGRLNLTKWNFKDAAFVILLWYKSLLWQRLRATLLPYLLVVAFIALALWSLFVSVLKFASTSSSIFLLLEGVDPSLAASRIDFVARLGSSLRLAVPFRLLIQHNAKTLVSDKIKQTEHNTTLPERIAFEMRAFPTSSAQHTLLYLPCLYNYPEKATYLMEIIFRSRTKKKKHFAEEMFLMRTIISLIWCKYRHCAQWAFPC